MDDGDTIDLISKNVRENVITRRVEKRLNDLLGSLGLNLLIDDPQNREGGKFMGTQMRQVRREARSQQFVAGRET